MSQQIIVPGAASKTGVILPANLSFDEWESLGRNLRVGRESLKFWMGDWMNYGESAYGEKYAQAIDATDFDYDYLRNIAYVCRKVTLSRRRDTLTFGHHQVVASLDDVSQEAWLETAASEGFTVRELREAIKLANEKPEEDEKPSGLVTTALFDVNVVIASTFTGVVEAENAEEAEKIALKEAKKAIDADDDVTFNIRVHKGAS